MSSVLFSAAVAVSAERTLLGAERVKRMTESDREGALRVLNEVGFGNGETDTESLITSETQKLCDFIRGNSPDGKYRDFFLLPYDFKNAEALIKSKYLKKDFSSALNSCGTIDVKTLKEKIFADEYGSLPEYMGKALSECDRLFTEGKADGKTVNALFLRALYRQLVALNFKDARLKEILSVKADCVNIGVAFRSEDVKDAEKQYVDGGKLSRNDLAVICSAEKDDFLQNFAFGDYSELIGVAVKGVSDGAGLKEFERLSDGFAVRLIKKNRYSSEGVFPFIRYAFYKFADIANARIILTGLSAGFSAQEISSRIREHYEG